MFALHTQMIYPIINLDDVDMNFRKGLLRIRDAIVFELSAMGEDIMLVDAVENWSLPAELMDPDVLRATLMCAAWSTAYLRYAYWYNSE